LEDAIDGRPEPGEGEAIVKVVQADGGYLYRVQTAEGRLFIGRLPAKFRKLLWVKPGTYVIVEVPPLDDGALNPEKHQGEILSVLYKDQISHLQDSGLWPEEFNPEGAEAELVEGDPEEEDEEESGFMVFGQNPNRRNVQDSSSDEED